jgi:hypothetical protein
MVRQSIWRLFLIAAVMFALATPALAGGWVVVTLDSLPYDIQAGQTISLGFMVLQHGETPIDNNPWENKPLVPLLSATNKETGETIYANARKEGPLGHFIVDVVFPKAGSWDVEITPEPFPGSKLGTFAVAAAASKAPNTIQQGDKVGAQAQNQSAGLAFLDDQSARVWLLSALVIILAVGLTAFVQRTSLNRWLAARKTRHARRSDEARAAGSRSV